MSAATLAKLIGKRGQWLVLDRTGLAPLTLPVDVLDARERFGKVDVLITPVGGTGQRWVESDSVQVPTEETA